MSARPKSHRFVFRCSLCRSAISSSAGSLKQLTNYLFVFEEQHRVIPQSIKYEKRVKEKYCFLPKDKYIKLEVDNILCGKCGQLVAIFITDAPRGGPGKDLAEKKLVIGGRLLPTNPIASEKTQEYPSTATTPDTNKDKKKIEEDAEKKMQELKAEMASLIPQLPRRPQEETERYSSEAKGDSHAVKKISDKLYLLSTTVDSLKLKVAALEKHLKSLEHRVLAA